MFLDLGLAKDFFDNSMIDPQIINHYEIYKFVQLQIQKGVKKTDAVYAASDEFKLCDSSIWRALAFFK